MITWIEGKPVEKGAYWLRLSPTKKLPERMQQHDITCYSSLCSCHGYFFDMHAKHKRQIESGSYEISGYIKLPEVN